MSKNQLKEDMSHSNEEDMESEMEWNKSLNSKESKKFLDSLIVKGMKELNEQPSTIKTGIKFRN